MFFKKRDEEKTQKLNDKDFDSSEQQSEKLEEKRKPKLVSITRRTKKDRD